MKGFIARLMAQDRRDYPSTIRQRMTERWAQRRLGRIDHERRVCEIASSLFDLTHTFHRLDAHDKRVLEMASIVHDIGRKLDVKDHPALGAEMVLNDDWLPLNDSERRSIAYLTRYHRGAVPEMGFDEILRASENRKRLRTVLAILRAADALDGRQLQAPRLVFAMLGKKLFVTVYLEEDTAKARRFFKRRKKFRLFEELIGLKVDVEIRHAHTVHTVS
jgi:exopolyphosphatase/guanosine-5'-triphosphate,3'-diphosphate pyrophosphatase